jgi:sugar phosphate isomerase/epimerase
MTTLQQVQRRGFLKTAGVLGAGIGLAGTCPSGLFAADSAKGAPNAEKLGWRLGCSAYIFGDSTFFGAVDKNAALGLHYIEAGRQATSDTIKTPISPDLTARERRKVCKKLSDSGVKMVSAPYWVEFPTDRRYFDFAKEMGIEIFVAEPRAEAFEAMDKLCNEYGVSFGIHNHPKPSGNWNPDTVLKLCQGHSKRIGACADTGHWMRSGLDPVACIKKLEGRIIYFHFKDINQFGAGHDVPWGTGAGNVKAMLTEVHRQKLQVPFIMEYEYNVGNLMPELAQSVAYFDQVAAELAAQG